MTRNQRLILRWLRERCSASGIIRCSSTEIADEFGLSQSQALRIMWALEDLGYLETVQKGKGRGPTKYRVLSRSYASNGPSGNSQQVHSYASKRTFVVNKKDTLFGVGAKENAQPSTHIRKQDVFGGVEHPIKPVKLRSTPFKRFQQHWNKVGVWGAQDFVCYFSYVHKVRFGEAAALNWAIDVGCARTLAKRLHSPVEFKAFIQVAFAICKRKPNGLRSFVYDYFYEQVVGADEDYIDHAMDEYDDEYVFPWLFAERKKQGVKAHDDYTRQLLKTYLGI